MAFELLYDGIIKIQNFGHDGIGGIAVFVYSQRILRPHSTTFRVLYGSSQPINERGCITFVDEYCRCIIKHFKRTCTTGRNNWSPHSHGFQDYDSERFVKRRQDEQVGILYQIRNIVPAPQKLHFVVYSQFS